MEYNGNNYELTEDPRENTYNEFTRNGLRYDLNDYDWCANCEDSDSRECLAFWHTIEDWTCEDGTENAADWDKPDLVIVID